MENFISCPNCEAEIDYEIVTSIHETSSAVEELFHGNLNKVFCHECAVDFHITTPMTFRSDDGEYIVFYHPMDEGQTWQELEQQMAIVVDETTKDLPPELDPDARLVINRNQFIEKIALYLNNLDDRIIEYVKFIMYRNGDATWPLHNLYYDFNSTGTELIDFTVLESQTGKADKTLSIPKEVYDQFIEDVNDEFDPDRYFPDLFVQVQRLLEQ